MAPSNEELLVGAVVVGLVALVVFNQDSTEAIKSQPPDEDTKLEAQQRAELKKNAEDKISKTVGQMRGWAYSSKAFLEKSGAVPEGEDHTDGEYIQMGALLTAARELIGRLEQNCREYNEGVWVTDRWERRQTEDEEPKIFADYLEQLEAREHAWLAHFRQLKAKKAATKPAKKDPKCSLVLTSRRPTPSSLPSYQVTFDSICKS